MAIAVFAFGGLFKPLHFMSWPSDVGPPHWQRIVFACFVIAAFSFLIPPRFHLLRVPVFLTVGAMGSLFTVGAYADHLRTKALADFGADREMQHTFAESVRNAPKEYQFFLHAAVLKDCVPYAWSYGTMTFYRLEPNIAVNVLPPEWLVECEIHRVRALHD